ncbi:Molybdenum cofactor sulfurase [Mycena kentingensis (nom. inval.)]|nr:Molybdenum cofactor sulfurase [Mycena kentingensis (nom. inval.)]
MQRPAHIPDLEQTRHSFLRDASDYGYAYTPDEFHKSVQAEYPALQDTTYLDHAASTPSARSTLLSFADKIEQCRGHILQDLFGLADPAARAQWEVIFTSGATAALKLVGDAFPWRTGAQYAYLKQSHTSLVGVRGVAMARGVEVAAMEAEDMVDGQAELFAYSAQCNATGSRLGLGYGRRLKERNPRSYILLDASAYLSTSVLDLGSIPFEYAPDFIACSFYKIVGFPTGLGCLVVKKASGDILQRSGYFGGGTIDAISVSKPFWSHPRRAALHERFEDGTLPFLDIIALKCALDTHKKLFKSQRHIFRHVSTLLRFASREMAALRHANGRPVIKQHRAFGGLADVEAPGPVIGFSVLDPAGEYVGHVHLEQLATINGLHIRTGGLCNTGVLASTFDIKDEDIAEEYGRGRSCWDDEEFGAAGHPLGMARISFGASSTIDDVLQWLSFLRRYFVVSDKVANLVSPSPPNSAITLKTMMLYPIKSCGGQSLAHGDPWEIVNTGLLYDREWMLVDANSGKALSQKQYPRMAMIRPRVVLDSRVLLVSAPDQPDLSLPLDDSYSGGTELAANVCADIVPVSSSHLDIDAWFSNFLGVPCSLRRLAGGARRHAHFDRASGAVPILLSNESPFLLISQASVDQVNAWIDEGVNPNRHAANSDPAPVRVQADCFRANFLLAGALAPFAEDAADLVRIGSETFQVLARCRRCLMVCVDQSTGCRTKEPFSCLARRRKSGRGRIEFGVHLMWREDLSEGSGSERRIVRVGDPVTFLSLHEDDR